MTCSEIVPPSTFDFASQREGPSHKRGADRLWQEVEALNAGALESLLLAGQSPDPRRVSPAETPLLWVTRQGCRE